MNYGIDQLKLRNAGCLLGTGGTSLPGLSSPVNGATTSLTCQRVGGGIGDIQAWAAVMTGIGVPTNGTNAYLLSTQSGNSADKILGGPVYMDRVTNQSFAFGPTVKIKDGPLYYHDATCASPVTPSSLPARTDLRTEAHLRTHLRIRMTGRLRRWEQTRSCRTSRFSPEPRSHDKRFVPGVQVLVPTQRFPTSTTPSTSNPATTTSSTPRSPSITRSSPRDFLIRPSCLHPSCPTPTATRPLPPTRTRSFRILEPPSTSAVAATSR